MFAVVFNADLDPESLAMVMLGTYRDDGRQDDTCVFEPSDHPEFRHRTVVIYDTAVCFEIDRVVAVLGTHMNSYGPLTDSAYDRLVDGFATSSRPSPKCVELLVEQGLIDKPK